MQSHCVLMCTDIPTYYLIVYLHIIDFYLCAIKYLLEDPGRVLVKVPNRCVRKNLKMYRVSRTEGHLYCLGLANHVLKVFRFRPSAMDLWPDGQAGVEGAHSHSEAMRSCNYGGQGLHWSG